MKATVFTPPLLVTLLCLAVPAHSSQATADEEAVVQTIRLMYVAAANDDAAKLRAVSTPDFYLFDVGKKLTGDELMAMLKSTHAAGKTIVWNVTEPRVRIEGTVAWITYLNRGYIQDEAEKKDVSWLESAVLLKEGGNWRIQFFHSTRMAAE